MFFTIYDDGTQHDLPLFLAAAAHAPNLINVVGTIRFYDG